MSKIYLKELNQALRQCGIGIDYIKIDATPSFAVFHSHAWDHGYDGIKISPDGGINKDSVFSETRRQFYADMNEMMRFLLKYFSSKNIEELIIAPCHQYYQFTYDVDKREQNDIYSEIYAFLRKNDVRKNQRSGIRITLEENIEQVEMIVEGAFRGVTELCLFAPTQRILLAPDHHFGITFFTQNKAAEKECILKLLEKFQTLSLYDEDDK